MKKQKPKKQKKERGQGYVTRILLYMVLVGGIGLMAYPFVSNFIFDHRKDSTIETFKEDTKNIEEDKRKEELKKAQEYNKTIVAEHVQLTDPFKAKNKKISQASYSTLLNLQGSGIMGYVKVPSINVELPIYHGTSETVLENGVGHLEGTSLPVGGENTHCVLTGHTGLNKAKLFTDLTQVQLGDVFVLSVLNEKLAYKVDKIEVVLPEQTNDLGIVEGKDLCTLVTCTPYGINSHRLFVRGHRVPYVEEMEKEQNALETIKKSEWMRQYTKALALSLLVIIILIVGSSLYDKRHKKRKIAKRKKKKNRSKTE